MEKYRQPINQETQRAEDEFVAGASLNAASETGEYAGVAGRRQWHKDRDQLVKQAEEQRRLDTQGPGLTGAFLDEIGLGPNR